MALLPTGWIKMPGDNDETKRFAWSHVKSIFYNKAANILLKDKLDEMDRIIDEKIAKALMSNVQVNDQSKVPTSALAYAMQQSITKNTQDITNLNSDLRNTTSVNGSLLEYALSVTSFENVSTGDPTTDIPDSARYCIAHIMYRANSWFISIEGRDNRLYMNYNNGTNWTGWNSTALKSDLPNIYYKIGSTATNNPLETIKQNWNDMPDGYYLCEISCGSAYIGIVQHISNGKHGSVLVNGYGDDTPIYVKRLNGVWK